jgi:PqqD family protein of HPr-rel-A system
VRYFVRAPGAHFTPLGDAWGAFSTLSGESHVVNDESVLLVEALDERTPRSTDEVCRQLAAEHDMTLDDLQAAVAQAWDSLVDAGLIREVSPAPGGQSL